MATCKTGHFLGVLALLILTTCVAGDDWWFSPSPWTLDSYNPVVPHHQLYNDNDWVETSPYSDDVGSDNIIDDFGDNSWEEDNVDDVNDYFDNDYSFWGSSW